MKYLKLIFILFLSTGLIESLFNKISNYCRKDKNHSVCELYACGRRHCANNKTTCDYLISLENYVKVYSKQDAIKQKNFKAFIRNIRKCESNDLKNQWLHRFSFG